MNGTSSNPIVSPVLQSGRLLNKRVTVPESGLTQALIRYNDEYIREMAIISD